MLQDPSRTGKRTRNGWRCGCWWDHTAATPYRPPNRKVKSESSTNNKLTRCPERSNRQVGTEAGDPGSERNRIGNLFRGSVGGERRRRTQLSRGVRNKNRRGPQLKQIICCWFGIAAKGGWVIQAPFVRTSSQEIIMIWMGHKKKKKKKKKILGGLGHLKT